MSEGKKGKLGSSRLIKVVIMSALILLFIQMVALGMIFWITRMVVTGKVDMSETAGIASYLEIVMDILKGINVVGTLGLMVTTLFARYGLRETASSITGNFHQEGGEGEK